MPCMNQSISHGVARKMPRSTRPAQRCGYALRVRERERRAPRSAEQHPALDAEVRAQLLEVGDQRPGRVVDDPGGGRRAAGAALVEEHDAPERGIEEAAVVRQAAAARPAVQEHDRRPVADAAFLPVQRVPAVDRQPAGRRRLDRRVQERVGGEVAGGVVLHRQRCDGSARRRRCGSRSRAGCCRSRARRRPAARRTSRRSCPSPSPLRDACGCSTRSCW